MSFNIHHDIDFWAVEFVIKNGDDPGLEIEVVGNPPADFQNSANVMSVQDDDETHLFFLNDRAHNVIRSIKSTSPMVVGLQEAFYDQAHLIANALEYRAYARGREEDIEDGETNAILWDPERVTLQKDGTRNIGGTEVPIMAAGTFWYSDDPDEEGSITENADWGHPKLRRICSWVRLKLDETGRQFYVFNTHLQNDGNAGNGKRNRMKSVELLTREIADRKQTSAPVIVTGDFNDQPGTVPVDLMTQPTVTFDGRTWTNPTPMTDTFRQANPDADVGTKCENGGPAGSRIDYIFRWPNLMGLGASVMINPPGSGCPSDHLPVTADVSLIG